MSYRVIATGWCASRVAALAGSVRLPVPARHRRTMLCVITRWDDIEAFGVDSLNRGQTEVADHMDDACRPFTAAGHRRFHRYRSVCVYGAPLTMQALFDPSTRSTSIWIIFARLLRLLCGPLELAVVRWHSTKFEIETAGAAVGDRKRPTVPPRCSTEDISSAEPFEFCCTVLGLLPGRAGPALCMIGVTSAAVTAFCGASGRR